MYHGEKVAFGVLVQLVLENSPLEEIEEVLEFSTSVGLPVTFAELGFEDDAPSANTTTDKLQPNSNESAPKQVPDSQDEAEMMDLDASESQPVKNIIVKSDPPPPVSPPTKEALLVERAVTRVSSGAMRLKSVNEIVGATPRSATDRSTSKESQDQPTPSASAPESPTSRHKSKVKLSRPWALVIAGPGSLRLSSLPPSPPLGSQSNNGPS